MVQLQRVFTESRSKKITPHMRVFPALQLIFAVAFFSSRKVWVTFVVRIDMTVISDVVSRDFYRDMAHHRGA
jgi:hypothetical protein